MFMIIGYNLFILCKLRVLLVAYTDLGLCRKQEFMEGMLSGVRKMKNCQETTHQGSR